jgi:hypothetical protein
VTGQGEHTLTKALHKAWRESSKPPKFGTYVDGDQTTSSNGSAYWESEIRPTLLDVCNDTSADACNAWLNDTFEKPGQAISLEALRGTRDVFTAIEATAFARWAVKTLLLYSHPLARSTSDAAIRQDNTVRAAHPAKWTDVDPLYRDLRRTGDFPADLSLWLAQADTATQPSSPDDLSVDLVHTFSASGGGGVGQATTIGLAIPPAPRVLYFQLAYHPLYDFSHPIEATGGAVRIWPSAKRALDLATLPALDDRQLATYRKLFRSAGLQVGVDGLGGRVDLSNGLAGLTEPFGF